MCPPGLAVDQSGFFKSILLQHNVANPTCGVLKDK